MRCRYITLLGAIALLPFTSNITHAKVAPLPLPQLVARADFVGIVECETAGAVVAKYKVIESCRGAKAGEHIHIRTFVRFVGPQFQASLVGERFLVIAPAVAPDQQYGKPILNMPISWRQLFADYEVPYGQGPYPNLPDMQQRYAEAKKLVAAANKPEAPRAKPGKEIVWTAPPLPGPDKAQLELLKKQLTNKPSPGKIDEFTKIRVAVFGYEPTPMFEELKNTQINTAGKLNAIESAAPKASEAAWRCGQEREKHLKMLLDAREPAIRVVGAIYLTFENDKLGKEELARLTKLPDEPGAYAALALARRGDKNAVPRLLEVFKGNPQGRFYTNLRLNTLALLSNSAKKSSVPQPTQNVPRLGWGDQVDFNALDAWWREHSAKVTLHDPWLETLARQKID